MPEVDGSTPPSPLIGDATVTVNGVTYRLPGDYYAILQSSSDGVDGNGAPVNSLLVEVYDAKYDEIYGTVTTDANPPQFPVSITTPFSDDFGGDAHSYVHFDCSGYNSCAGRIDGDMSVSLVNESAIPEPSTWAMALVGFAGLGYAGFRGSRRAAMVGA